MSFSKNLTFSFFLLIVCPISSYCQNQIATGKILDGKADLPIRNAKITIKNYAVSSDSLGNFKITAVVGDTIHFYNAGYVEKTIVFSSQSNITITLDQSEPIDRIYSFVDETAEPQNGMRELFDQLGQYLIYPAEARRNAISGEVVLFIVIGRNGEVQETGIVKGIGYGCEEAALTALRSTTVTWKPAIKNGIKVRSKLKLPLKFKI